MEVAVYDTKPYDRLYLSNSPGAERLSLRFLDFHLNADSAPSAAGAQAACIFVNDRADRECLDVLAEAGVKLIALRSAGYNHIDLPHAHSLGLKVVRVPAYSPNAVAEHTIGLLLALNRKIHRAYMRVREFNFSLNGLIGFNIAGKTVGIVGTGAIGRITAQILRGFDANVIGYDPFPSPEWASAHGVEYVGLDQLWELSDIISLHAPLTPDTHHMLNAQTIARCKPGVVIINTSRGKLIDTRALIASLKSGHVSGVALDVYEEEENIFFNDLSGEVLQDDELSRLLTFPNVLITAHQAFLTDEALREIARITTENLLRFDAGAPFLEGTEL